MESGLFNGFDYGLISHHHHVNETDRVKCQTVTKYTDSVELPQIAQKNFQMLNEN